MELKKLKTVAPGKVTVKSVLLILTGLSVVFLMLSIKIMLYATDRLFNASFQQASGTLPSLILVFSLAVAVIGFVSMLDLSMYRKIYSILKRKIEIINLKQLADELLCDRQKLLKELSKSINNRMWSAYAVSDTAVVFKDSQGKSYTLISEPQKVFKETLKRPLTPLWTFPLFLSAMLISPPGSYIRLLIAGISFTALFYFLHPKVSFIEYGDYKFEAELPRYEKIKGEQPDALLVQGYNHLSELKKLKVKISGEKVLTPLSGIISITAQIFDYINENPGKIKNVREFVNYYLPTTIKLLGNYCDLAAKPVKGENITNTLIKIENIMSGIHTTCGNILNDLYKDNSIDINAEISVMENMMNEDGGNI